MSVIMLAGDHCAKLTAAGQIVGMSAVVCDNAATKLPNLCVSQCETKRCPPRDEDWLGDVAILEQTSTIDVTYFRGMNVT